MGGFYGMLMVGCLRETSRLREFRRLHCTVHTEQRECHHPQDTQVQTPLSTASSFNATSSATNITDFELISAIRRSCGYLYRTGTHAKLTLIQWTERRPHQGAPLNY